MPQSGLGWLRRIMGRGTAPQATSAEACGAAVYRHAAHVSQAALYGYLRTRMGTQFPRWFSDPAFAPVIVQSRTRLMTACAGDLTLHAVARAAIGSDVSAPRCGSFALCIHAAMRSHDDGQGLDSDTADTFGDRVRDCDWDAFGDPDTAFMHSIDTLVACAPVSQQFKDEDADNLRSGLRFRWIETRRRFWADVPVDDLRTALLTAPEDDDALR